MSSETRDHERKDSPTPPGTLDEPTVTNDELVLAASSRPERIGRYHLKRVIASGGMGTIYEATQDNPRRVVAVKVMKQGIASKSALRRFEYEAQVLARLRHPCIAQIYEAGTHYDPAAPGAAVPFFAMEYIPNAKPVTKFADEKKLGTRERMDLFVNICEAVHHGHQKGIIHRDLKPGNILVDSHGEVKVIDFGVARGTDSDLAVTTLQTDIGQLIGTLQYMSPEQCEGDPHDIDTRSDVYSLGVVLYELLSGTLPYDVSRSKIFDGTRMIREQQPAKLSTMDTTLRGDVETIVFKALEKDRDRRFQSAVEFAQDIRRYLSGEAITARPPSIIYQLRVFARRNKGLFTAIAAVFIILVSATIVTTLLYLRAEHARAEQFRERQRAELAERDQNRERQRAEFAAAQAERERDTAQAVMKFLSDMLSSADPEQAQGREVTVREVLDKAASEIPTAFRDRPLTEAALRLTIGNIYLSFSLIDAAELHLRQALELRRRELGNEHLDVAQAMQCLAWSLAEQGRFEEADSLFRGAIEIRRKLLGPHHLEIADTINDLADTVGHWKGYKTSEVESLHREALAIRRRLVGNDHPAVAESLHNLAAVIADQGNLAEAERLQREALTIRKALDESNPNVAGALLNLGIYLRDEGKLGEAEGPLREAVERWRVVYGETHPNTAIARSHVGVWLTKSGRFDEAEKELLEVDGILRPPGGSKHRLRYKGAERLVALYEAWDVAEPDKGYAEKAARWRAELPAGE